MRIGRRTPGGARGASAAAVLAAAVLLGAGQGSGCQGADTQQAGPEEAGPEEVEIDNPEVEIYAAADWYRARPEPEERWEGTLEKVDPVVGPAGRTSLTYALRTADRRLPVYAAGVQERLAPFTGRAVRATGKLVDLSGEGLGRELWIASIGPGDPPPL
ncbi:MAG TPA: hypothetical protein VF121_18550 [Thermoanaerobaculia bacterium]|nr:hypothetical protein [Thermoanaerobaculia bacterium]